MAIIKKLKRLGSTIRGAKTSYVCTFDKDGNVISSDRTVNQIPKSTSGTVGKVWTSISASTTGWADVPTELPAAEVGDAGKVLTVNADETAVEWKNIYMDVSSLITPNAALTINDLAAVKIGNVVILNYQITNSSESAIPSLDPLLTFDNSISPKLTFASYTSRGASYVNKTTKTLYISQALNANDSIYGSVIYIIAE